MVVGVAGGWRLVDDIDAIEAEQRTWCHQDRDIDRLGQFGIGCQVGRFRPADANADRAAIIALVIEGRDDALVIAPRLGQQAGRARGGLALVGQERRGIAHRIFGSAGLGDREIDLIGLGIGDDRFSVGIVLAFEQFDAEDFECSNRRRRKAQAGRSKQNGAKTRYQTRDMQWTNSRPFTLLPRRTEADIALRDRKIQLSQSDPDPLTLHAPNRRSFRGQFRAA
jgi:hypothetical protein